MARCCIRRILFSFIIRICSAIPCISRWRPSRSRAWLVFPIGCDLLSKGLLVLGLDNKRLRKCIWYKELLFLQTVPNYYGRNLGASNQQSELLLKLDIGLGRPAQGSKRYWPRWGRYKPLRCGDQIKASKVGKVKQVRYQRSQVRMPVISYILNGGRSGLL